MASKYWIKLYHEILDDLKMGSLPADLWRFTVELFLLAGELDCNGTLPNVTKIAWRLRYTVTQVETWLEQLSTETDIVTKTEGGWIVTNFAKRQAASEINERVKQFRERQKKKKEQAKQQLPLPQNGNETLHQSIDTESDTDKENKSFPDGKAATEPPIEKKSNEKPHQKSDKRPDTIPAVQVFSEVTKKYCLNKTQMQVLQEVIGDSPIALEKWRNVVTVWNLRSYKPTDIDGMLEWFKNGIPERYKGINGHNKSSEPNKRTQESGGNDDPIFRLFAGKPA